MVEISWITIGVSKKYSNIFFPFAFQRTDHFCIHISLVIQNWGWNYQQSILHHFTNISGNFSLHKVADSKDFHSNTSV